MLLGRVIAMHAIFLLLASSQAFALPKVRRGPTSPRVVRSRSAPRPVVRPAEVRRIEPGRAIEIQSALIKSGYLSGNPSGNWDTETEAAMRKLQSDNGWQTKLTPDSRAIIKLGLGSGSSTSAKPMPVNSRVVSSEMETDQGQSVVPASTK